VRSSRIVAGYPEPLWPETLWPEDIPRPGAAGQRTGLPCGCPGGRLPTCQAAGETARQADDSQGRTGATRHMSW